MVRQTEDRVFAIYGFVIWKEKMRGREHTPSTCHFVGFRSRLKTSSDSEGTHGHTVSGFNFIACEEERGQ
jgi:hypothetical protein